jgi:large subunit ribosomal protein L17
MRHGNKINHLGRTASHRKALLSNMATSLILHKRITTTLAKAKALRKYVEPLLTKSKVDTSHSRRTVFSYLHNNEAINELFGIVSNRIASRPGGYTRIIKLGNRLGDNAETCIIELVDFNELLLNAKTARKKTRRSRRKKGESSTDQAKPSQKPIEAVSTSEDADGQEAQNSEPIQEEKDNE